MGRLASGQVMSLMFIIPGLWLLSLTVSTPDVSVLLYYLILCLVALLNSSVDTLTVVAAVLALASCLQWDVKPLSGFKQRLPSNDGHSQPRQGKEEEVAR